MKSLRHSVGTKCDVFVSNGVPKVRVQVLLESTFTFDFGSVRNHDVRNFSLKYAHI